MIKLQDGELLDLLPSQLKNDTDMICLSYALKNAMTDLMERSLGSMTQNFVELLPEQILDVLAVELRTPYYDQSMEIGKKQQLIRTTMSWYMKAGTAQAMKDLISIVFGGGEAVEWFEMPEGSARPGEFDVTLGTLPTDGTMEIFVWVINAAKNMRSHLRRMLVTLEGPVDGPDLLDGRTEPGAYGIDILYFLTYYGEYHTDSSARAPEICFLMGMDFWETEWNRHNGKQCHNGAIRHWLWRRYGIRIGINMSGWSVRTIQNVSVPAVEFRAEAEAQEALRIAEESRIPMHLISYLMAGIDFRSTGSVTEEGIGEVSLFSRTRNLYFHNGQFAYNGVAVHRTIYKEEIIA